MVKKTQPVHPGAAPDVVIDLTSVGEAVLSVTQQLEEVAKGGRLQYHNFEIPEYKALEKKFDGLREALRKAEREWAMSKGDIQTRRICVNADGPEVLKYDLYLGGEMAVAAQKVVTTKVAEADDAQKQSEATKQTLTRLGTGLRAAGELALPGQGGAYADHYLKEPKAELAKFEQRAVEHQAAAVSARNNFEMLREKTQKCIVPVRSNVEIQFGQAFDALKASGENGAIYAPAAKRYPQREHTLEDQPQGGRATGRSPLPQERDGDAG